jgi:hypothetical protein
LKIVSRSRILLKSKGIEEDTVGKLAEVIPGWSNSWAVAEYLGCTPQHVRRIRGDLGGVEVSSNTVLYPVAKVRAFKRKPLPKVGWKRGRARA